MSSSNRFSSPNLRNLPQGLLNQRGLVFGGILILALIGFEIFNFSTTEVALEDLLGNLEFAGISWATILTIAFCGIDFAGIARLFVPEDQASDTKEVWYLFGAWLLAATMNAILTWWGISLSLLNRSLASSAFIDPEILTTGVPVFVALLVWVTRVLLIGTFSVAGNRVFTVRSHQPGLARENNRQPVSNYQPVARAGYAPRPVNASARSASPANGSVQTGRPEPEYVSEPGYSPRQQVYQTLSGNRTDTQGRTHTRQF